MEKILPTDLYYVAREADTERPFTGKYNDFDELGEYYCAVCGTIYSEVRLNLLPLAVGQAFLKPTKMAFLIKEILHTEWSV